MDLVFGKQPLPVQRPAWMSSFVPASPAKRMSWENASPLASSTGESSAKMPKLNWTLDAEEQPKKAVQASSAILFLWSSAMVGTSRSSAEVLDNAAN